MKHQSSTLSCSFATLQAVAILAVLAGCGGDDDPASADSGVLPDSGGLVMVDSGAKCSVGGTGGGTGGSAGGGVGAIPANFETVKLVLGGGGGIMPCSAAPCHGVNGAAPPDHPLELPPNNDQQLYANLTSYVSKACGNTKLVNPCNPAQSALVSILKGACGVTPRMPYGCSAEAGDCIPDEYIAAVAQWITNGAPRP